jgi:hypothetical protein
MVLDILKTIFEKAWEVVGGRRRLRLTVHRAFFTASDQECFFVNVTNVSKDREVEITHVWFDCTPQISALQIDRQLPKRLKPDETWETWIDVDRIPTELHDIAFTLARARLSTGKIIKSTRNANVPHEGMVPGGQIRRNR